MINVEIKRNVRLLKYMCCTVTSIGKEYLEGRFPNGIAGSMRTKIDLYVVKENMGCKTKFKSYEWKE